MRVAVYPADEGGCGCYRLIWPSQALIEQGFDITLHMPDTDNAQIGGVFTMRNGVETVVGVQQPEADVVVLQRPLDQYLVDIIPFMQEGGATVIVEIDDDFRALNPRNVAWRASHPKNNPQKNWSHLDRACEMADLVTVSTPALAARYGKHGRVKILPNFVPERYLSLSAPIERDDDHIFLGWTGSVITHPDDMQVVKGAVWKALRASDSKLAIIGSGIGVHRHLSLAKDYEVRVSDWLPILKYPEAMAQFDVGIVPLELSAFNNAKSWLKGLEYASTGVPFVASPTDEYIRLLNEYGIGNLAHNPKEWERKLMALLTNDDYRIHESETCRKAVDNWDLTIERQSLRWMKAWAEARHGQQ